MGLVHLFPLIFIIFFGNFVSFSNEIVAELFQQHDSGNEATSVEATESDGASLVASSSQRSTYPPAISAAADFPHSTTASLRGSSLFAPDCRRHDRYNAVALSELQTAQKVHSNILLQPTLAECHRSFICPSAQTRAEQSVCTGLESRSAVGTELAIRVSTPEGTISQASQRQETQRQYAQGQVTRTWSGTSATTAIGQWQRQARTSSSSSSASAPHALARLHAHGSGYAHDDASNATDAFYASGSDQRNRHDAADAAHASAICRAHSRTASEGEQDAGVDGLFEAPWTRPSARCISEGSRVHQKRWSTSKERLADSSQNTWRGKGCFRSGTASTHKPHCFMEHLPHRRCSHLERVCSSLSDPRDRAPRKDPSCTRSLRDGQRECGRSQNSSGRSSGSERRGRGPCWTLECSYVRKDHRSMQFMTNSLVQFQQKAEEIHTEVQSSLKRPRLILPESMDTNMPPPKADAAADGSTSAGLPAALQPFGGAGRQ